MTSNTPGRPILRRLRSAVLPAILVLAGAQLAPALRAKGESAQTAAPGLPSEADLQRQVQANQPFRDCLADALTAYRHATDHNVDPELETQQTREAQDAHGLLEQALEYAMDAGLAAWDQALEAGNPAEVAAYQATAREAFSDWLYDNIISSVVTLAEAEASQVG